MSNRIRLLNRPPKTLEERYFSEIRPLLYERHATHHQYGVRKGTTLAEHLDSACQFILTVSRIAEVPEDKRPVLLAATAVHDLNKLDSKRRNVKTLARDREFLREQLEAACNQQRAVSWCNIKGGARLLYRICGRLLVAGGADCTSSSCAGSISAEGVGHAFEQSSSLR